MSAARQRVFLFLQGPLSPLYDRLGAAVRRAGHRVHRINLNVGDVLHWRGPGAESYRGHFEGWRAHVAQRIDELGITDIVLHGDRRPYHAAVIEVAAERGLRSHVTELGLLRPGYLTLVQGAAGAPFPVPRQASEIRRVARSLPPTDLSAPYATSFWRVAAPDVVYNLAQTFAWPFYPHYRRHTIYFPPVEYAAWVGRLVTARRRNAAVAHLLSKLDAGRASMFVYAMQLEGDFQVRANSPFVGQAEAIALGVRSFARHAPSDAHLLVKTHPLDNGLERWARVVPGLAQAEGVGARVHLADGGWLLSLMRRARGLVTINSTAGLEALLAGVPVAALTSPVYAVAGATHQGSLDTFWQSPQRPDPELVQDLVAVIAARTQVRGSIYDRQGLEDAVTNIAARLLAVETEPVSAAA